MKIFKAIRDILFHPALLFAAGNTVLALEYAESVAISINIIITLAALTARSIEVVKKKDIGIPFTVLAIVNFFTAGSTIYVNITSSQDFNILGYIVALAYTSWGIGHLLAARIERRKNRAQKIIENPQTVYGLGDMLSVNASGSINPFAFPFMIIGFIKSIFIGKHIKTNNKTIQFMYNEFTSARIYATGFVIGSLTSLYLPYFAIAQILWALAYFSFRKDT